MQVLRRYRVWLMLLCMLVVMAGMVVDVILEERFPRRVEAPDARMALQGDRA